MYPQPTARDQYRCHMLIVTQQEVQIFEPGRSKMPSSNRSSTDRILGSGTWHCLFELRYHLHTNDWLLKFPGNKYFQLPLAHKSIISRGMNIACSKSRSALADLRNFLYVLGLASDGLAGCLPLVHEIIVEFTPHALLHLGQHAAAGFHLKALMPWCIA